jgi:hypothetical protein
MMTRFGFNIRTKAGQRVDNIQILAATLADAERRLRRCTSTAKSSSAASSRSSQRNDTLDLENVIGMISAAPSGHKTGTQ